MTRSSALGVLVAALVLTGCGGAPEPDEREPELSFTNEATPFRETETEAEPEAEPEPDTETETAALRAPRPAASPRRLAERLVDAERTVRGGAAPEAEVRQAAFDAQVLYRQLARTERWQPRTYRLLPARLRAAARAHVAARRDFRGMHSTLSDSLPAWRIVDPAPARRLLAHYRLGERRYGVPWEVLAAINLVETGMGRIRGTSVAGARGPMQFMPATWAAYGKGDIDDPRDAILAAARYLADRGGGRSGRLDRALYAYNNHPAYVRGVKRYAAVLRADPRAFTGLYHWQVVYLSEVGDVWLPHGYERRDPVPVRRYVAVHPGHQLGTRTG